MCLGTGIYKIIDQDGNEVTQDPCETCKGEGYLEDGKIDTSDIMDELADIKDKVNDIFEKINE